MATYYYQIQQNATAVAYMVSLTNRYEIHYKTIIEDFAPHEYGRSGSLLLPLVPKFQVNKPSSYYSLTLEHEHLNHFHPLAFASSPEYI